MGLIHRENIYLHSFKQRFILQSVGNSFKYKLLDGYSKKEQRINLNSPPKSAKYLNGSEGNINPILFRYRSKY